MLEFYTRYQTPKVEGESSQEVNGQGVWVLLNATIVYSAGAEGWMEGGCQTRKKSVGVC